MLFFGSFVYNVLSVESSKFVVKISKSDTEINVVGSAPSQTPATVAIPSAIFGSLIPPI